MPTFDAGSSAFDGDTGDTISVSHTATGTNRVAIIDIDHFGGTLQGVTYGGVSATLVTSVTNANNSSMTSLRYRLIAPATGSQTVTADFTGTGFTVCALMVHTYTDVDQTTPITASATAQAETAGPATVNVSSASGQLVVDNVFTFTPSITVGAGQTVSDVDLEADNWLGSDFSTGVSQESGAGTVTMSWTLPGSGLWNIIASSLQAPAAGAVKRNNLALLGVGR